MANHALNPVRRLIHAQEQKYVPYEIPQTKTRHESAKDKFLDKAVLTADTPGKSLIEFDGKLSIEPRHSSTKTERMLVLEFPKVDKMAIFHKTDAGLLCADIRQEPCACIRNGNWIRSSTQLRAKQAAWDPGNELS